MFSFNLRWSSAELIMSLLFSPSWQSEVWTGDLSFVRKDCLLFFVESYLLYYMESFIADFFRYGICFSSYGILNFSLRRILFWPIQCPYGALLYCFVVFPVRLKATAPPHYTHTECVFFLSGGTALYNTFHFRDAQKPVSIFIEKWGWGRMCGFVFLPEQSAILWLCSVCVCLYKHVHLWILVYFIFVL